MKEKAKEMIKNANEFLDESTDAVGVEAKVDQGNYAVVSMLAAIAVILDEISQKLNKP